VTKESKIGRIYSTGIVKERYWKRILVVDDDTDRITTFKFGVEYATNKRIAVDAYNDPKIADSVEFSTKLL
jgi:hypothetical protein